MAINQHSTRPRGFLSVVFSILFCTVFSSAAFAGVNSFDSIRYVNGAIELRFSKNGQPVVFKDIHGEATLEAVYYLLTQDVAAALTINRTRARELTRRPVEGWAEAKPLIDFAVAKMWAVYGQYHSEPEPAARALYTSTKQLQRQLRAYSLGRVPTYNELQDIFSGWIAAQQSFRSQNDVILGMAAPETGNVLFARDTALPPQWWAGRPIRYDFDFSKIVSESGFVNPHAGTTPSVARSLDIGVQNRRGPPASDASSRTAADGIDIGLFGITPMSQSRLVEPENCEDAINSAVRTGTIDP